MELLTSSDPRARATIAGKFPADENPAIQVHIGSLIKYEITYRTQAWPRPQFLNNRFVFNPGLRDPEFQFLREDIANLEQWESQIANDESQLKKMWASIPHFFPELSQIGPDRPLEPIRKSMKAVGSNVELVKSIYSRFRTNRMPKSKLLDESWALFRLVQLNLLTALRYFGKYGPNADVISKLIRNDVLDMYYVLLASLVGRFATLDKGSRQLFSYMCPTGELVPRDNNGNTAG